MSETITIKVSGNSDKFTQGLYSIMTWIKKLRREVQRLDSQAGQAGEKLDDGVLAMADTINGHLNNLGNKFSEVMATIAAKTGAGMEPINTTIGRFGEAITILDTAAQDLGTALTEILQNVDPEIPGLERMETGIDQIIAKVGGIGQTASEAVQTVQTGLDDLAQESGTVLEKVNQGMVGVISEVRDQVDQGLRKITMPVSEVVANWETKLQTFLTQIDTWLKDRDWGDVVIRNGLPGNDNGLTGAGTGSNQPADASGLGYPGDNSKLLPDAENAFEQLSLQFQTIAQQAVTLGSQFKATFEEGLVRFLGASIAQCLQLDESFQGILQQLMLMASQGQLGQTLQGIFGSGGGVGGFGGSQSGAAGWIGLLGSLFGYAEGGRVSGPGSGSSDSILARLSNGEWVMKAAAVQHYGPRLMDALNRMLIPRMAVPGFASGGLVGGERSVTANFDPNNIINLEMINLVDYGVFDRYLETSNGKRQLINIMSDKRDSIRKVIL